MSNAVGRWTHGDMGGCMFDVEHPWLATLGRNGRVSMNLTSYKKRRYVPLRTPPFLTALYAHRGQVSPWDELVVFQL